MKLAARYRYQLYNHETNKGTTIEIFVTDATTEQEAHDHADNCIRDIIGPSVVIMHEELISITGHI